MEDTQRAWAEIDLDAIAHNVKQIRACLNPGVKLMAVVKADAYGHGAAEVAETALENGAERLAVAFVDEAIQLRNCGITVPILILGASAPESVEDLLKYDITPAVFTMDFAEKLSETAVRLDKIAKVHIAVDTGMFRIGFGFNGNYGQREETVKRIVEISHLPNIEIEGMFSHFSTADECDSSYTETQFKNFIGLADRLKQNGVDIPIKHIANSAAQIRYKDMQLDMVRAGIILYGLYPSDDVSYEPVKLKPAMTFKTRVINVKEIQAGDAISYGRKFKADKTTKVATISVGYADGYSRIMSGKAEVLVNGEKLKQIGRICMDQCMIDATNVNNIDIGDEVILFGDSVVTADDVAAKLGSINYEVVCVVGKRIPRIYIKNGKIVKNFNYLLTTDGR